MNTLKAASGAGGRRLWFEIARVIAEIQTLCTDARAVTLRDSPNALADEVEVPIEVVTEPEFGSPLGRDLLPNDPAQRPPPAVDVVELRSEIRSRLMVLKARLSEVLTEREVYYTVFPVVVYVDELVQIATGGRASDWPPLQRELYDIDNGGELFYQIVETLLKREETSPLIFETFYFCLSAGFQGQFQSEPTKIEEYKARLAFRIPTQKPATTPEPQASGPVDLVPFPWRYYVASAAVLVGLFVLLRVFGWLETTPLG